ncbi:MAG: hypothetical protein HRF40_11675 [Nitrososphaera sp.]
MEFVLEPEFWLSSCTFFIPDFLIANDFIVEILGPLHKNPHQAVMDRLRRRALANSGYPVYEYCVHQVDFSLSWIVQQVTSIKEKRESQKFHLAPRIIEVDVPPEHRFGNISQGDVRMLARRLDQNLDSYESLAMSFIGKNLSDQSPSPLINRCAMESIILKLIGLRLRARNDGLPDFVEYSQYFRKALIIVKELFGPILVIEVRNMMSLSATGMLKNLIFCRKSNVSRNRIVWIRTEQAIRSRYMNSMKHSAGIWF